MSSSRNHKWLLTERDDDYKSERVIDPKEYFAGVHREWAYRVEESEQLRNDLRAMGVRVPLRRSLSMPLRGISWTDYKRTLEQAVSQIREENNRMLMRRCRFYMFQLACDAAAANGRQLSHIEQQNLLNNEDYRSDYYMSDEE